MHNRITSIGRNQSKVLRALLAGPAESVRHLTRRIIDDLESGCAYIGPHARTKLRVTHRAVRSLMERGLVVGEHQGSRLAVELSDAGERVARSLVRS